MLCSAVQSSLVGITDIVLGRGDEEGLEYRRGSQFLSLCSMAYPSQRSWFLLCGKIPVKVNLSDMFEEPTHKPPATLADVLYATSKAPVPEHDWASLVQSIAGGDQLALHALYERAHRPVFTLIMRITANRETAEELTIDVFHDVWRRASSYDAANGTVLGWIMNQARSRAIDRLRFESRKKRSHGGDVQPEAEVAADPRDVLELREQGEWLRAALAALTPA